MLLAGDEMGRTQQGNNNAYCQDNEISWVDWNLDERQQELLSFTRQLVQLRHRHPVLRRPKFFQERRIRGRGIKDIHWLGPGGEELTDDEWNSGDTFEIGMLLDGEGLDVREADGRPIHDDTLLLVLNGSTEPVPFSMPAATPDASWEIVVDTASAQPPQEPRILSPGDVLELERLSVVLLRCHPNHGEQA